MVSPDRRVQGVERILTTTMEYALQNLQFVENVERRGTSSMRVQCRLKKIVSSINKIPEQSDKSFFLGAVSNNKEPLFTPRLYLGR